jgi:hypothetical protein
MAVNWTLTFDCANPVAQAAFWRLALGYVEASPPTGWATWEDWKRHFEIPEEEWNDGATIEDPDGIGPRISFLKVPEPKTAKNRVHPDIQAGGGRIVPTAERWPRVLAVVERLVLAGATATHVDEVNGTPDHVVMADPEGNEFCVL